MFSKPLAILKARNLGRPAWWSGVAGMVKVRELIDAFKQGSIVFSAYVNARISKRQYEYFCSIHPSFTPTKARLKRAAIQAKKQGLAQLSLGATHVTYWDEFIKVRLQPEFMAQMKKVSLPTVN